MRIDYNTCNIVFPINTPEGKKTIFLPPANIDEVRSNALVLGRFASLFDEVNTNVLLTDYDIYLNDIIEDLALNKYDRNEAKKEKYITDSKLKINAMLERCIVGGYYFEDNEVKPVQSLDTEAKEIIKGSMLFFIVINRYVRPRLSEEETEKLLTSIKITCTSQSSTDWMRTSSIPSQDKEISVQSDIGTIEAVK
ncbi:hypothetical protein [Brachyspira innocens]|uniref:hypothetical protein n=1 Tax=Brachyspira innocens TaxID=13264 RepID=UPI0026EBC839|nr:hypothetical protein [Brachyspira innocens]